MKTLLIDRKTVILLFLQLYSVLAAGQIKSPIKAGLLLEQISLPNFRNSKNDIGLGFTLGTEFHCAGKKSTEYKQTLDFLYFYHAYYSSSFVLSSQFDFRLKTRRLYLDVKIGPGYMLFSNYSPGYKFVNGRYEKMSRLQNKLIGTGTLSITYSKGAVKPYLSYSLMVETPFINSSSSVLPHQIVELGMYYTLSFKKK